MLIKPVLTPSGKTLFRLKLGQLLLGVAMLSVIGVLIIWSFASYQTHDSARETVLAEESDSSALVFVQRESFGLIVELEEYLLNQNSQEELLTARATLAQRLNVITSTGQSTYEVAGAGFRLALQNLDAILIDLDSLKDSERLRIAADAFLTETRLLTDLFQGLSRTNIQDAVAERAIVDFWQGALSLMALSLGLALFIWVVRDLITGFRLGYRELAARLEDLDRAKSDFLSIQLLDEKISSWNSRLEGGERPGQVVAELNQVLQTLAGQSQLSLTDAGELRFSEDGTVNAESAEVRKLLQARLNELMGHIQRQSRAREQLEWEQNHDNLTGLLNRRGMATKLVSAATHSQRTLLVDIDLDGFTGFNNSMGQAAGDALLREVAANLKALKIENASVGRVAADEFGLVVTLGTSNPEQLVEKITAATHFASSLWAAPVAISACIGWHVMEPGESAEEAAAKAGAALKSSKSEGALGTIRRFETEKHSHLLTDYLEQIRFRNALLNGELVPFLQPIVSLETRQVEGFEVLARWEKPGVGIVSPAEFLPLATQGGLLDELFEVMLETVSASWTDADGENLSRYFSVNVDPKTLAMTDFAERVKQIISRHQVGPQSLVLEITEQSLVDDSRIQELIELRNVGVRIALDDFGTGYSSLSRLSSLPIDILKVDRSFIAEGIDGQAGSMLETIRSMAQGANLRVVVEGIEDEQTAQGLMALGFHSGQGYLFGRPAAI